MLSHSNMATAVRFALISTVVTATLTASAVLTANEHVTETEIPRTGATVLYSADAVDGALNMQSKHEGEKK